MSEFTGKVKNLNQAQKNYINRKSDVKIINQEDLPLMPQEKAEADGVINDMDVMSNNEIESNNDSLPETTQLIKIDPC